MPLWHADHDDRSLWVRYPRSLLAAGLVGFTPNLEIAEGRLVVVGFVVGFVLAIGAMMAMLLFPVS